jgi:hypothetical protein
MKRQRDYGKGGNKGRNGKALDRIDMIFQSVTPFRQSCPNPVNPVRKFPFVQFFPSFP